MKAKHLSALCTCALLLAVSARSAEAAIISSQSDTLLVVSAGVWDVSGTVASDILVDSQNLPAGITNYSNTLSAFAGGITSYYEPNCNCMVSQNSEASATASISLYADLAAGIFSGSGSYGTSTINSASAEGAAGIQAAYWLTTPYAYTLTVNISAGSGLYLGFNGSFADPSDEIPYTSLTLDSGNGGNINEISVLQSGILNPGSFGIIARILGDSPNQGATTHVPSGSFAYTLTLTPTAVPVPAAAWLFGSGFIGLLGIARRKAV